MVATSLTLGNLIKIVSFSSHTPEVQLSSIAPELPSLYCASARERLGDGWSNRLEASTNRIKASKASIKEAKHVITQRGKVNMLKDKLKC